MKKNYRVSLYLSIFLGIGLTALLLGYFHLSIKKFFIVLFLVFISGVLLIFLSYLIGYLKMRKVLREMTYDLKVDEAIAYFDKVLSNFKGSRDTKLIFYLDKAMALHIRGRVKESLAILNNVGDFAESNAKPQLRILYFNNLLTVYLDTGMLKEAQGLYKKHGAILRGAGGDKSQRLRKAVEGTLARYEIDFGDAKKSKKILLELLPTYNDQLNIIVAQYYIALADLKLGNKEEAILRAKKFQAQAKGTYFYDLIGDLLKSH